MARRLYTRSGTRREGDDYQDLIAAELMIESLEHSDRYAWIKVEADEAGALDDVTARRRDGTFVYRQVKFAVDPAVSLADWDYLTKREKGAKKLLPSLLERWQRALRALVSSGSIHEASLVTNRVAAPDLACCLRQGRVALDLVPAAIRPTILGHFDNDEAWAIQFFSTFQFKLDSPMPDELEDSLSARLFKLGGDDHGWANLLREIRRWVKYRDEPAANREISLDTLRRAVLWRQLPALTQEFEVPADYVSPGTAFTSSLRQSISDSQEGRCLVLWAPPGSGKSTYVSQLVKEWRAGGGRSLRHHYFISLTDGSGNRFDHGVVLDSLLQQLETYDLASSSENPRRESFRQIFEAAAARVAEDEKFPLLVVVDGVDHVWRERKSLDEVSRLFELLLPAPPFTCVLIATQRLSADQLPIRLLTYAPERDWIQLPPLSQEGVQEWLSKHIEQGGLDRLQPVQLEDTARAFAEASGGNPLYLKLSFAQLLHSTTPVTAENVRTLNACESGQIQTYYTALWNSVSPEARHILHVLAESDFAWPVADGLLTFFGDDLSTQLRYEVAYRAVRHLLAETTFAVSAYHSSLLVFIQGLPEHARMASLIHTSALRWLTDRAPSYWRWAYEWLLRARTGDAKPLIDGATREWVVNSLVLCRPRQHILKVLDEAQRHALMLHDFAAWVRVSILASYVRNIDTGGFEETLAMFAGAQLRLREDPLLEARLASSMHELMDYELVELGEAVAELKETTLPKACFDELREREERRSERGSQFSRIHDSTMVYLARLRPLTGPIRTDSEAIQFWNRLADRGDEGAAFGLLCRQLWRLEGVDSLQRLCESELEDHRLHEAVVNAVRWACTANASLDAWRLEPRHFLATPYLGCFQLVTNAGSQGQPPRPLVRFDELDLKDHEVEDQRRALSRRFHSTFFAGFQDGLASRTASTAGTADSLSTWAQSFVQHLYVCGTALGAETRLGRDPAYGQTFVAISECAKPDPWADRGRLLHVAIRSVAEITLDLRLLLDRRRPVGVTVDDVSQSIQSPYWSSVVWLEEVIKRPIGPGFAGQVDAVLRHHDQQLAREGSATGDRAHELGVMALAAVRTGLNSRARDLLQRSALHLLGYGYHKDMAASHAIDCIRECAGAAPSEAQQWIKDIAPTIADVDQFTDGDETRYFPAQLAEAVLDVVPEWFPAYYEFLVGREDHWQAELSIATWLRRCDLGDPIGAAIAKTVVDGEGLRTLVRRQESGDAGATEALRHFTVHNGSIARILERSEDRSRRAEAPEGPPDLTPWPPAACDEGSLRALLSERYGLHASTAAAAWLKHWVEAGQGAKAFNILRAYSSSDFGRRSTSILMDVMFDHCRQVEGAAAAFEYLVRAQRMANGWSPYSCGEDELTNRLDMVSRFYPERTLEFVVATLQRGPDTWGSELAACTCAPRLVKFFVRLGRVEDAIAIVRQYVASVAESTRHLPLRSADWFSPSESVRILATRLTWPVLMVREKAARQFVRLILSGVPNVREFLARWAGSQPLESRVVDVLMVLQGLALEGVVGDVSDYVAAAANRPSVLSDILLARGDQDLSSYHSGSSPSDFQPSADFTRLRTAHLPAIYDRYASTIPGFHRQWAYEADIALGRTSGFMGSVPYYFGSSRHDPRASIESLAGEALRSGFLRAVAWGRSSQTITTAQARRLALQCAPLDVSVWPVENTAKPDWWPSEAGAAEPGEAALVARIWDALQRQWDVMKDGPTRVLHAFGPVCETPNFVADLRVVGAWQRRISGAPRPSEQQLATWADGVPFVSLDSPSVSSLGRLGRLTLPEASARVGAWQLTRAAFWVRPWASVRWQPGRWSRGVCGPWPIADGAELRLGDAAGSLEFVDGQRVLGTWRTWVDALHERELPQVHSPGLGTWLATDRAASELAADRRDTFCWIAVLRVCTRPRDYDDFSFTTHARAFGAREILTR